MIGLIVIGIVGVVMLLAIWRGFVLSYLWQWFLVPLGVSEISIAHAIGLSVLVGMFTSHIKSKSEDAKGAWQPLVTAFAAALAAFGLGYIVHAIMS